MYIVYAGQLKKNHIVRISFLKHLTQRDAPQNGRVGNSRSRSQHQSNRWNRFATLERVRNFYQPEGSVEERRGCRSFTSKQHVQTSQHPRTPFRGCLLASYMLAVPWSRERSIQGWGCRSLSGWTVWASHRPGGEGFPLLSATLIQTSTSQGSQRQARQEAQPHFQVRKRRLCCQGQRGLPGERVTASVVTVQGRGRKCWRGPQEKVGGGAWDQAWWIPASSSTPRAPHVVFTHKQRGATFHKICGNQTWGLYWTIFQHLGSLNISHREQSPDHCCRLALAWLGHQGTWPED